MDDDAADAEEAVPELDDFEDEDEVLDEDVVEPVADDRLADEVMVELAAPVALTEAELVVLATVLAPVAVLLYSSQREVAAAWAWSRSLASVQLARRHETA